MSSMSHIHSMETTTMDHSMHHNNSMGMNMSYSSTTMSSMNMAGNHHHNHNMGEMDGDMSCMGGMMMYFHTGKCEFVLFEKLKTTNTGEMVGACVAIFFVAILYEALKVFREYLLRKAMTQNRYVTNGGSSSSQDVMVVESKQVGVRMISGIHFVQTFLHMIQVFISYCLMLVFMTYNVWLCIAVIVGAGVGYFLFGWTKSIVVDMNEHCH